MTRDHESATPPLSRPSGLLARQRILALVRTGAVAADAPIEPGQLQPASLDLRLSGEAYRVRASFLPGRGAGVFERLKSLNPEKVSLEGDGAVLEKGIVYIAPLVERLGMPRDDGRIGIKVVHRTGPVCPRV
jgi:dCTP deaminase